MPSLNLFDLDLVPISPVGREQARLQIRDTAGYPVGDVVYVTRGHLNIRSSHARCGGWRPVLNDHRARTQLSTCREAVQALLDAKGEPSC